MAQGSTAGAKCKPLTALEFLLLRAHPMVFFRTVYSFENEILLERLDRMVHAAAMSALQKTDIGYRFYFAVYVQRVSRITAIYMALIDPFRRWIVYSAIFKQIERSWTAHFGPTNLHNRD